MGVSTSFSLEYSGFNAEVPAGLAALVEAECAAKTRKSRANLGFTADYLVSEGSLGRKRSRRDGEEAPADAYGAAPAEDYPAYDYPVEEVPTYEEEPTVPTYEAETEAPLDVYASDESAVLPTAIPTYEEAEREARRRGRNGRRNGRRQGRRNNSRGRSGRRQGGRRQNGRRQGRRNNGFRG